MLTYLTSNQGDVGSNHIRDNKFFFLFFFHRRNIFPVMVMFYTVMLQQVDVSGNS